MNECKIYFSGDDIYKSIKMDILTMRLKPGQMISENEIANAYHVSRTPVKTAFLRLKGEKYIDIFPQKGSIVTLLDMKYIKDVIYMRTILEIDMLAYILKHNLVVPVCEILGKNILSQYELLKSKTITPLLFYDIDSEFHYTLFEATDRQKMWSIIQDCQVYYTRFRILDTATTARYQMLIKEHEDIVKYLREQDMERLKICVFSHLHGNLRMLAQKITTNYKEYFV